MRKLFSPQVYNNASWVTLRFLKQLGVPVTHSTVVETLEQHPDYPSLYSISDCLKKWKVQNVALRIEAEKLDDIPPPFIACTKLGGGNFILVNDVNGVVDYIDTKGKPRKKTKDDFAREFDKIVLVAEKSNESGERDYPKKKRKELVDALRMPMIIIGSLLLITLHSVFSPNIFASLLLGSKFFGAILCSLFLWYEIDQSNPIIRQICFGGNNSNCTSVLNSKWSKPFGLLSLGEAGFFYFAGGFLSLLLSGNKPPLLILGCLSVVVLPFTILSIYYQWRVIKQWCSLCLVAQGVLLLEFAILYLAYTRQPNVWNWSGNEFTTLLASFLLPLFFWTASKRAYINAHRAKGYTKELKKIKQNRQIFDKLLATQTKIPAATAGLGIVLGDPAAQNTILKICNPYCVACAKTHAAIDEILDAGIDVKVQIIFRTINDGADSNKVVSHFLAIRELNNGDQFKNALHDWYASNPKNYDRFAAKYPLKQPFQASEEIERMNQWCHKNNINYTPAFFVNGYKLPDGYSIDDVQNLL